jgi:iron complex outermembrane receptor protein
MKFLLLLTGLLAGPVMLAQTGTIRGRVTSDSRPLEFVTVGLPKLKIGTLTDSAGRFTLLNVPVGAQELIVSNVGYQTQRLQVSVLPDDETVVSCSLKNTASTLDEVVVTGVSRGTEIRKSPFSIAMVTKKEMEMNVNNNIIDAVLKGVPGLSAVTTGPNISKPFIRGLGYNRVLTLYNGVRQEGQQWGDEHGVEIDQYGIERAEVVKGPASLIYGSDALAGVINFIPYVPKGAEGKVRGDVLTEYHTNNGMVGASAGLACTRNGFKWSARASQKRATAYTNRVDGRVYGTAFREWNLSGMVGVDRRWGSSFLYATAYENLQEIPDGSRDSLTRRFTRQVLDNNQDDIKNRPFVPDADLRTYRINPLHQHIQHYRVYTRNQIKLGEGEFAATVGGQQSVRREYNHPTHPDQAGLFLVLNTLNYDFKYNFPVRNGWEATLGANGMYQSNRHRNGTEFPIPNYHLFDLGGYVFLKKSLGKVDISGGLRTDLRTVNWADQFVKQNPATGYDKLTLFPDTAGAALQFPAYSRRFSGVSGSIGLTYNLSQRVLLKANVARGYRAPNITEIGSNGLDPGAHIVYLGNRNFNPEFSLQTDLAFLATLNSLDVSVELFNNTIQNYIYQARLFDETGQPVVIVPGNFTYQYQQSKAQLYGLEVSLNWHPASVKWLHVNNSLSYVRGLNRNDKLIEREGDAARYLPFIPPLHTRSEVRASFQKPVGVFSNVYVRAEVDHFAAQNRFYGVDNTETFTAGYTLLNVGTGATVTNRAKTELFQVFLQVDNLFDVAYQSHLNRLKYFEYYTASPNGRRGIYNMGRNASVKVIVPF